VNTLQRMVARNYPSAHRFSCITDQTEGFDPAVRVIPLWKDHAERQSLYGADMPTCYRRLKAYSSAMKEIIGPRFISVDLDVVITGDLTPVFERPEDFVIWGPDGRRTPYNGSMWMMDAGAREKVWLDFDRDPDRAVTKARGAGYYGSDQAWMCYALGPDQPRWRAQDGVCSYRMHVKNNGGRMPPNARIVFFEGHYDPWNPVTQKQCPWIKDHYW
jgi:hypothetical protein